MKGVDTGMLPNFLIAGGVATGTSFLSATLTNHPDIYLPRIQRPEPNYFHYSHKYDKGIDWYQQTWFSGVKNEKAVGERSSLLLPSENAVRRLMNDIPDIKLIFCLRNPIERAWGNYRFTVLEGLEPLSFEDAIECEQVRNSSAEGIWSEVRPHAYTSRSMYARNLLEYIDTFGKERILLLKSELLGQYPDVNIARVCEFLGVDSTIKLPYPPNYSSPSVKDRMVQMELRTYFGDRFPEIVECIRQERDISTVVQSDVDTENALRLKANLTGGKEILSGSVRKYLREYFEDDINLLKPILDFSVEDWV